MDIDMDVDVVVIGAGVIGLTSALRLQHGGLRVAVVAADPPLASTSAVAAAVWYPSGMAEDARVAAWAAATFAEFTRQAADGVPGVSMRPTRMLAHRRAGAEAPWWAAGVPDLRRVGSAELAPPYRDGWEFTAPAVEMPLYLPWLLDRFHEGGGVLVLQRLGSLGAASGRAPAVVNASGLGARELCGDPAVHPVRGQLVLVRNPGLRRSLRVQDDPAGYVYVHPRSTDVVLGGTFDADRWDATADPEVSRAILRRCAALAPELRDAQVIDHRSGLRPARRGGIRLETDLCSLPGTRLVHNYGHGGAGVTLCWGCADTTAALVGTAVS
ncbi:FAD-dependent oxidoreductase [Streptantibioticus cattleyicolor]|uniref:D-amino-acid oxidase n=1 Tax=Streptantibioticus cattleyicolor (strain ATCC 35852 / DSM 46488 / JCM 4925 / NBRC 14057 / NRRL 8057) TaxID=1003195 RepID=F8JM10_STREN|nr:FAD-dependent oxidoreductase [Streptantibioticus cattleyicolor]AEW99664.1 D-amino-acid oxidase [Streptantibioticus cattleyicolor NRRL 8057 = DSM 46488]CCB71297.1 D-amino acid oxidase [Streptantibioticus cattleyicolor NRRL 8057 = DSM 46488]